MPIFTFFPTGLT
ncbi:hypothetical protein D018_1820A, partial [Vibrio parahaemolyticus VP2007-007]